LGNVSGFVIAGIAVAAKEPALGLIGLGLLELTTMLSVIFRVQDSRAPLDRAGRSWLSIAGSAWATDILKQRSYVWLLVSRLSILMAGGILTGLGLLYLRRSLGYGDGFDGVAILPVVGFIALGTVIAVLPAARLSDRIGRRPVIWIACAIGAVGLSLVAIGPSVAAIPADILVLPDDGLDRVRAMFGDTRYWVALAGAVAYGLSAGAFLAVDWALITDIIPKASSGRYMGISNVATASAGVLALAIGGTLMDWVTVEVGISSGPVAAMWAAVALLGIGALLLIPVDERPRDGDEALALLEAEESTLPAT
jgi:MFS family permease